jgi:hypothetical protein
MWRRQWTVSALGVLALAVVSACGSAQPAAPRAGSADVGGATASAPGTAPTGLSGPGQHLTESNPPGDIPDTQVFVEFAPPGAHFSVTVPEGWARTVDGDSVSFTDKLNRITMQERAAAAPATAVGVTASVVPDLSRQVPRFVAGQVTSVSRTAGSAVLVTYVGDSAPDPVTNKVVRNAFERYSFWKAGHEVVLTLAGPVNADNVDPWRTVSDSLRWR